MPFGGEGPGITDLLSTYYKETGAAISWAPGLLPPLCPQFCLNCRTPDRAPEEGQPPACVLDQ